MAEQPKGWRIVVISAVLPVAEPVIASLQGMGHDVVAWLTARRPQDKDKPPPVWGEVTDKIAPQGVNLIMARDKADLAGLLRGLEPDLALFKFQSVDLSPVNYGRYTDRVLDDLYDKQSGELDKKKRMALLRDFEKRALEQAYTIPTIWWHRIIVLNQKLKGWHITPSHYVGQDLADVWLGGPPLAGAVAAADYRITLESGAGVARADVAAAAQSVVTSPGTTPVASIARRKQAAASALARCSLT